MKEIDLSLYFEPCSYVDAGSFYHDDSLRLGRVIKKYTVKEQFPSIEGVQLAIIGLSESRGEVLSQAEGGERFQCNGADLIRKDLYNLYPSHWNYKMVDLGNLKQGKRLEDTIFALSEVISLLLAQKTVVILLGGTQDLTYAAYKAYHSLNQMVNVLTVDSKLNLTEGLGVDDDPLSMPLRNNSFMGRMVVEPDNCLFNYMNLGYQTYLVESESVNLMGKMCFDGCRYGLLRDDLSYAEPYLRDADVVSFDMSAVVRSESPGNPWSRPTGFSAYDACQLSRYAGLSKNTQVFGLFEYYPAFDRDEITAQLMAEMVWCFIDAIQHRCDDNPLTSKDKSFKEYIVALEEGNLDMVFFKCKETDRWWMSLPCSEEQKKRYGRHCVLACSYQDYLNANHGETPSRWWASLQRLR